MKEGRNWTLKIFWGLGILDVVCLAAPTAWMGAGTELTLATLLAAGTAASWWWLGQQPLRK